MADKIFFNARMMGGGQIKDTVTLQSQFGNFRRGALPARIRRFTHGTGNYQVNNWHLSQRTLAATTFDLLDLAGGLTGYKGAAITFTATKLIYVAIVDPDGTKSLRIGPQNQSNAGQFGWGGTGATVYKTTVTDWEDYTPLAGRTVTAGTGDIFPIYNPGAGNVTYALLVLGLG